MQEIKNVSNLIVGNHYRVIDNAYGGHSIHCCVRDCKELYLGTY